MGEEDNLRGKDLKMLYSLYFDKIKALKSLLDCLENHEAEKLGLCRAFRWKCESSEKIHAKSQKKH
jgi:hypothetical protein